MQRKSRRDNPVSPPLGYNNENRVDNFRKLDRSQNG